MPAVKFHIACETRHDCFRAMHRIEANGFAPDSFFIAPGVVGDDYHITYSVDGESRIGVRLMEAFLKDGFNIKVWDCRLPMG